MSQQRSDDPKATGQPPPAGIRPVGGQPGSSLERPPVPWHFKLIAAAVGLYVALRIVQMLGWVGVTVKDLHLAFAVIIIAVNAAVAVWGLLAWWRGFRLIRGFVLLAMLGWYLYLPQLAFGLALYADHHRAPTGWQHYIYGGAAVLGVAVGWFYRKRLAGREAMLYGLVALFLTGVAVRALITGRG